MAVTIQQLESAANARLDHYIKGQPLSQTIQDKPFLKLMRAKQSTFPGGRGELKFNVKNDYDTTFMGYEYDDTVEYGNPANMRQVSFPYFELHAGIKIPFTELKRDGINVVDSAMGEKTAQVEGREIEGISNILDDKLEDMDEGMERSFNEILWRDGTQSAKVFGGLLSVLSGTPTSGVVGGIDRGMNSWWRNRASLGIVVSAANQTLITTLRSETRQLLRYGGKPTVLLCGSSFLAGLETEVAGKGDYSHTGFAGGTDVGMGDIKLRGLGTFTYDPTLDDLGYSKYCFAIDTRHIMLKVMSGEDMKRHSPARPAEKYVLYRGVTWTGTLIARKLNAHGVYSIA